MEKIKTLPFVTYSYYIKYFAVTIFVFSAIGLIFRIKLETDLLLWIMSFSLFLILQSKEKHETDKISRLRSHAVQFTYKYLISLLLALNISEIWSGINFQFSIVLVVLISLTIQLLYFYFLILFTDTEFNIVHFPISEYLSKYYYLLLLLILPFLIVLIFYLIPHST
jgi:hypothetical protein